MSSTQQQQQQQAQPALTAEEILQHFLDYENDPIEIERLHNDMLLHYLRSTDEWNLSRHLAVKAIDQCETVTMLLRHIGAWKR
ncbi:hypothetical protein LXM25_01190 [Dyadobacter sp. LJ53]|uniref:hypothetical protein n=1 Tax=Dyadobacter chenwenxiniae TaxID=2906456 RepID=UPI001F283755|nr:hypothetical protein [Dyadobacter chenwenxiniae]MCF0048649.1 hypothetical protein [Dyadobacter chenwenxiniae]